MNASAGGMQLLLYGVAEYFLWTCFGSTADLFRFSRKRQRGSDSQTNKTFSYLLEFSSGQKKIYPLEMIDRIADAMRFIYVSKNSKQHTESFKRGDRLDHESYQSPNPNPDFDLAVGAVRASNEALKNEKMMS